MPVVPEPERIEALRRLGVSDALVRLSSGEVLHPLLRDRCVGAPPYLVYAGAGVPEGPLLVPLWDRGDVVAGVWRRTDGLEFIEFSIEADDEPWSLARTEQGFWARKFDDLWEDGLPDEDLRAAARAVGFRFLDELLVARPSDDTLATFDAREVWLAGVVGDIDRRA